MSKDGDSFYRKFMPETSHIVYAIGFKRRGMPTFSIDGQVIDGKNVSHDKKLAHIVVNESGKMTTLKTAYGFGIGFPQETIDPQGNVETSVGIWKFRKYITASLQ